MAKYLKPRRGAKDIARSQNFILYNGEMFLEFPNGNIGKEPGRVVIGDGNSSYTKLNYTANNTNNEFQPFITDPSIYVPRFNNTTCTPESDVFYSYNAATTAIEKIGNGSTAGEKLPDVIGAIKESLCKINENAAAAMNKEGINVFEENIDIYNPADVNERVKVKYDNIYKDNGYWIDPDKRPMRTLYDNRSLNNVLDSLADVTTGYIKYTNLGFINSGTRMCQIYSGSTGTINTTVTSEIVENHEFPAILTEDDRGLANRISINSFGDNYSDYGGRLRTIKIRPGVYKISIYTHFTDGASTTGDQKASIGYILYDDSATVVGQAYENFWKPKGTYDGFRAEFICKNTSRNFIVPYGRNEGATRVAETISGGTVKYSIADTEMIVTRIGDVPQ